MSYLAVNQKVLIRKLDAKDKNARGKTKHLEPRAETGSHRDPAPQGGEQAPRGEGLLFTAKVRSPLNLQHPVPSHSWHTCPIDLPVILALAMVDSYVVCSNPHGLSFSPSALSPEAGGR